MQSLLENFGIDWKLLLAQAVNFLLLLLVLRVTVYKPLLKLIAERRKKIKDGLVHAEAADARLASIGEMEKKKQQEAEAKGLAIIRESSVKAKVEEARQMEEAAKKVAEMQKRGVAAMEAERGVMMSEVEKEAVGLMKAMLKKAVAASPEHIDEALMKKIK